MTGAAPTDADAPDDCNADAASAGLPASRCCAVETVIEAAGYGHLHVRCPACGLRGTIAGGNGRLVGDCFGGLGGGA